MRKAQRYGPIRKAHGFLIKSQELCFACVPRLLFACGPTAVRFAIRTIVVYSFNRVLGSWSWPHIGIKVSKIMPSFANRYPAPAIPHPILAVWVCASSVHRVPCSVFVTQRHAMSPGSLQRGFQSKTPAGLCCATVKPFRCNGDLGPTITNAQPQIFTRVAPRALARKRCDRKPIKSFPSNVPKVLADRLIAWNDFGRIDVFTHIGFSEWRSLQGGAVCVLNVTKIQQCATP